MNKFKFPTLSNQNNATVINANRQEVIIPEPFTTYPTHVRYRKIGSKEWINHEGIAMDVPDTNRIVHTIELDYLEDDSEYEFQTIRGDVPAIYLTWKENPSFSMVIHFHTFKPVPISQEFSGYNTDVHKFKTAPLTINGSFKVAQISDTHGFGGADDMIQHLSENGARVIIHSGDLATGNGGDQVPSTWYHFFRHLNSARDLEGFIVPFLANLGNHEVWKGRAGVDWDNEDGKTGNKPNFETGKRGDAEWYYCFFPSFPSIRGYGNLTFGDYFSVWQLDPGISTTIYGKQTEWLEQTLLENTEIPHKFVSLHYNFWTAGRVRMTNYNIEPRKQWGSIFENSKVLVLTGHDHVWSVSPPIKGGTTEVSGIDYEDGIVYLGAGVPTKGGREGRNYKVKWWIEKSIPREVLYSYYETGGREEDREPHEDDGKIYPLEEVQHYWMMELFYDKRVISAVNGYYEKFYEFTQELN